MLDEDRERARWLEAAERSGVPATLAAIDGRLAFQRLIVARLERHRQAVSQACGHRNEDAGG